MAHPGRRRVRHIEDRGLAEAAGLLEPQEDGTEAMIADIATGETDWADIFFLIALILFAVGAVLAFQAKALWASVVSLGLVAVSLGWLVL
jgi:hypothetical protein